MATPEQVVHLDRVPSTQDEARRRFAGAPVLVTATAQSAGRGREGSTWMNADRAVAASLAFHPDWPTTTWPRLTLVAGLAATDRLPAGVGLKWPNDLVLGGAKLGGILTESTDAVVVVGLGINVYWADPPVGMTGVHERDPGADHGRGLAERWAASMLERTAVGPGDWGLAEYIDRCVTLGEQVTWDDRGVERHGVATGIDDDGALIVESDGEQRRLVSAAVRRVRHG